MSIRRHIYVKCNQTAALTKTSKCNRFLFDVALDISYVADAKWENSRHLWQSILTTITCQIGHKYKNWKKCSYIITEYLLKKVEELKPAPSTEWKGTISISGQYVDEDSVNGYSEIIYDWFSYAGFMAVSKDSQDQYNSPPVSLQYTIRFLFNPALPIAQQIYSAKGYKKIYCLLYDWKQQYENIMNTKVDHEKEYNHLEIWQTASNTYKLLKS
ncbi:hypothetical protein PV327_010270 [Microctonus hyperodae]|uniref:Uncharacterized protein n=1 Tax=Microctonus hyperodae TaxID=165561 RepID=A0AA39FRW3_MICHY|nr:hypothetical protein PV327_010270 [Microctonus hyperodae]